MWNPSTCDCECNNGYKRDEYLDIKNFSFEKGIFVKLALRCKDEIFNKK